jgi:hypothetical protein
MATKEFNIIVDKWWGKESVVLHHDCFLSKLKKVLCDELIVSGILSPADMDTRNLTPHIKVLDNRRGRQVGQEELYRGFDNVKFSMMPRDLLIGGNLIEFDAGNKMHFTIVYKRGIGAHKDAIKKIIDKIWPSVALVLPLPLPLPVEEKKNQCTICMDQECNCAINCGHVFCMSCAEKLMKCPVCRQDIVNRLKIFTP